MSAGEFEHTLLHSFHKGAFFRQWLLCPDCPPFLQMTRDILDKAYGYAPQSPLPSANSENVLVDVNAFKPYMMTQTPSDVLWLVGHSEVQCFSHVAAAKGYYTIPTEAGVGSSYVCFKPDAHEVEWVAGQIQHIFEQTGTLKMAIKRSIELRSGTSDPFAAFWKEGFQAKMVSSRFSNHLEIVDASCVIAHTARWNLSSEIAVVLNLSAVCTLNLLSI